MHNVDGYSAANGTWLEEAGRWHRHSWNKSQEETWNWGHGGKNHHVEVRNRK